MQLPSRYWTGPGWFFILYLSVKYNGMKLLTVLSILFCVAACKPSTGIGKQLDGSDSLVINFNTPNTNTIDRSVTTTEEKAINKLAHFVDAKPAQAYKRGYDGNLMFYKKGQLLGDVAFNYSGEGCHHFILNVSGVLTPTTMSNEAADFLSSLAKGKNWY
jgi:hypothetical protein